MMMASFSFVNGWVDAICLIRYEAFATMMVGNLLTFGHSAVDFWLTRRDDPTIVWLPDPLLYVFLVLNFMLGVSLYRVLERKRGWSGKHFAPLVVVWVTLHDLLESRWPLSSDPTSPNRWNVLRLAPVFGLQDAMTVRNGFGSLPWCTTNNVVTMAFASTDLVMGGCSVPAEEWRKLVTSCIIFGFMVLGTVAGSAFDALCGDECRFDDLDIAVVAPLLGLLFLVNDWVFPPATQTAEKLREGLLLTG